MAINATTVWRVRPSGSNTNGGGYDAAISGAGTDYSQQNSAQASGTHGSCTTSTFTDSTAAAFTTAMVGNAMYITGGGATTGFYFVISRTNANTVVLDRSPGGSVSGATWHLGGGWADFWTNTTANIVGGNRVLVLGSGTPNPASYTYDYTHTSYFTPVNGDATNGRVSFEVDPATPGYKAPPDTTGGMPVIKVDGLTFYNADNCNYKGLWFVASAANNAGYGVLGNPVNALVFGCVLDQFGNDIGLSGSSGLSGSGMHVFGCEIFSSVSPGSAGSSFALYTGSYGMTIVGCNIHDTVGNGVSLGAMARLLMTTVAKCRGVGVQIWETTNGYLVLVQNNTIDGNLGHGIEIVTQTGLADLSAINNIISNHTQAGKYGMTVDAGTTAANDRIKALIDYNTFYNNTTDVNAISYGAHDTHGGSNPFVGQSTENYALA